MGSFGVFVNHEVSVALRSDLRQMGDVHDLHGLREVGDDSPMVSAMRPECNVEATFGFAACSGVLYL